MSWVDPSRGVRTQEDCRPIANNSSVVECLCKEREVVDEETGQLTALRVEKAQWVSRSGGFTRATTICRLSTYLSWIPPSPASACRTSGSPAAAWDSDQDVSVSSLETNSSFLPWVTLLQSTGDKNILIVKLWKCPRAVTPDRVQLVPWLFSCVYLSMRSSSHGSWLWKSNSSLFLSKSMCTPNHISFPVTEFTFLLVQLKWFMSGWMLSD